MKKKSFTCLITPACFKKMWISNYIQGRVSKLWQLQTVNSNEHLNFWWIVRSLKMFPPYHRLVIISAHNKQRNGFRKSRTVLFWHFRIMTFFFLFPLKLKYMKKRKGWKGWRTVRKNLQSFFHILWNTSGQTEGFVQFCFAGKRNVEYMQHFDHENKK